MQFDFLLRYDDEEELFRFSQDNFKFPWSLENVSSYLKDPNSVYCVLVKDGTILGYTFFHFNQYSKEMHLYQIFLIKEFRSQGLAEDMLRCTLDSYFEDSESVFLEVEVTNLRAISFYERLGFKKLNRIKGFYSNGADAYAMHCESSKLAKLLKN